MRRSLRFLLLLLALARAGAAPVSDADLAAFAGVWTGHVSAPNESAEFGVAFTRTERGLLFSLNFPAMFVHGVNFGPAEFQDGTFTFPALDLTLRRDGDALVGIFALARLPVRLARGTAFAPPPAPAHWPAAPAPVWLRALGTPVWASPVARSGLVYIAGSDGRIHALNTDDGTTAWTWAGRHALYGAPLVTDEALWVLDEAADLVRIDRLTGKLQWRTPLHDARLAGGPPPASPTFNHRAATPIIDEKGVIYVGSTDHGLYAVNARTGRIVWRTPLGAPVFAPPSLFGDLVYVGTFDGSVVGVHRRKGKETFRTKVGGPVVSTPVVAGGTLVVGARDCLLYGLDRLKGTVRWRHSFWFSWIESTPRLVDGQLYLGSSDFRRVSRIDPTTGARRWAADVGGLTWGTPIVTGDTVYAATAGQPAAGTVIQHQGGIVALDRETGVVRWHYPVSGPAGADLSGFPGSLTLDNGLLIGAGLDGTVIALRLTPTLLTTP